MIRFTKMHGLGNDFVVIDTLHQSIPLTENFIRAIANRHYGVGCDQVLIVGVAKNSYADFSYRIFNADGTEVYQCGNGARCVGLLIRQKKFSDKKTVVLETQHSTMSVTCIDDQQVMVETKAPCFDPSSLPFLPTNLSVPYQLLLNHGAIQFEVVNVGNPHCVIEINALSTSMMQDIGQQLNAHHAFPKGVNVGFVQILSPSEIHLCVYERGAGMTQACGSGACAAVAVLRKQKKVGAIVNVHQSGGALTVTWKTLNASIQLTGPAAFVFEGMWSLHHNKSVAHFKECDRMS